MYEYNRNIIFGFMPLYSSNPMPINFALNAINTYAAQGIIAEFTNNLAEVRFYVGSIAGAPTNIVVEIWSSDGIKTPQASLGASNVINCTSGLGFYTATFSTPVAVTIGTQYFIVIKNATTTPASDYITLAIPAPQVMESFFVAGTTNGASPTYGWWFSTCTAGVWSTTPSPALRFVRIRYANGVYSGSLVSTVGTDTNYVYSNREKGIVFTTPSDSIMSVAGVTMIVAKGGNPTGSLKYKLYDGGYNSGLLLAESALSVPPANITIYSQWISLPFPKSVNLRPNSKYKLVLAETTQSDVVTNRYYPSLALKSDPEQASLDLISAPNITQCYYDGSVWSEQTNFVNPFGLLLSKTAPFKPASLNRRQFNSMR